MVEKEENIYYYDFINLQLDLIRQQLNGFYSPQNLI